MIRRALVALVIACLFGPAELAGQPAVSGAWGASVRPETGLVLEAPAGLVSISPWDRDSIDVQGAVAPSLRVVIARDSGVWRWTALPPDSLGATLPRVSLDIRVPRRLSATLQLVDGETRLRGLQGAVSITLVAGRVEVRDHVGSVDVDAVEAIAVTDQVSGPVRVRTSRGAVALGGVRGRVDVVTVSAPVTLSSGRGGGQVRTIGGAVTVRDPLLPGDSLYLQTHDGPILVQVSPARSPLLDLSVVWQQRVPVRFTQSRADGTLVARSFKGRITLTPWPAPDRVLMSNGRR